MTAEMMRGTLEASLQLAVCRTFVKKLCRDGVLKGAWKTSGTRGKWQIPQTSIDSYKDEQKQKRMALQQKEEVAREAKEEPVELFDEEGTDSYSSTQAARRRIGRHEKLFDYASSPTGLGMNKEEALRWTEEFLRSSQIELKHFKFLINYITSTLGLTTDKKGAASLAGERLTKYSKSELKVLKEYFYYALNRLGMEKKDALDYALKCLRDDERQRLEDSGCFFNSI